MNPFPLDRRAKFLLLVGFLIASFAALPSLPFMVPWGADLQNVHAYVRCAYGKSPYLIDGVRCGDLWGRAFYYPPFLFHFFFWMRRLTLEATMHIWTVCLYLAFAVIFYAWACRIVREPFAKGDSSRHEVPVFCALLLFQYPFVLALERGNTDTVAISFYTLAAYWFGRRRLWLAGMAAGLAAGFRLYPALAVIVVTVALLLAIRSTDRRIARWGWLRFGGGAFAAFAATLLVFPKDALIYFRDVLPAYAKTFTFACEFSHSVPTYVGAQYPGFAVLIAIALLGLWAWASARAIARGEEWWALAGALAVSTYNQRTSWDYNLITVYPLLLLLFLRARRTNRWALLAFGVFTIAGDRRLFALPNACLFTPQLQLALELAFLATTALVVAGGDEGKPLAEAIAP
jgi:Glycosyltransferase family 87